MDEPETFGALKAFRIGFSLALGGLAAYALAQAIVTVRQVLVLLLVSAFLAVGLDPAVTWLERRGLRRGVAVTVVVFAVLALFAGFIAAIAQPLSHQATQLVDNVPDYVAKLRENKTIRDLDNRYHFLDKLNTQAGKGSTFGLSAVGGVVGVGKAVLGFAASLLTVIILTLYLLTNLESIKEGAFRLVPKSNRPKVRSITDEVLVKVGGYVLGNLATSVIAGLVGLIWFFSTGTPYPVALALLIAILDLVPLIGATVAAVIVSLVAGLSHSLVLGLVTFGFFTLYQQFENYVLVPRVMRRTVDVSGLTSIVAALIGAALLGIIGALLAIPAAAAVQIVVRDVVVPQAEKS